MRDERPRRLEKAQRFEDLLVWQKARVWVRSVYEETGEGSLAADFALRDQLRRCAVSVMSNIAEGFERGSRQEFARFVAIAKTSCAEARSRLYVALDKGYLQETRFKLLLESASELGRMLGGLRVSLLNQDLAS